MPSSAQSPRHSGPEPATAPPHFWINDFPFPAATTMQYITLTLKTAPEPDFHASVVCACLSSTLLEPQKFKHLSGAGLVNRVRNYGVAVAPAWSRANTPPRFQSLPNTHLPSKPTPRLAKSRAKGLLLKGLEELGILECQR